MVVMNLFKVIVDECGKSKEYFIDGVRSIVKRYEFTEKINQLTGYSFLGEDGEELMFVRAQSMVMFKKIETLDKVVLYANNNELGKSE